MSHFRNWVRIIWLENTEEHQIYHELPYTMEEYWKKYKWWLKREYQYRRRQGLI
jgi:hypothetical protein